MSDHTFIWLSFLTGNGCNMQKLKLTISFQEKYEEKLKKINNEFLQNTHDARQDNATHT